MNKIDAAIGLAAKETLKANPNLTYTVKCQRGLNAGEKAITLTTLDNGKQVRSWNHLHGRQVTTLARKYRAQATKVEYAVAADNGHGVVLRITGIFTLGDSFALIPA